MTAPLLAGFLLGLSLILPIGAQNAFVLRIGLRGEHVFAVCLACALSDAVLIVAGVSGFAQIAARVPWAETAMRYAGAAFLIVYGARSFIAASRPIETLRPAETAPTALGRVVLTCLAFTWLNPHVYLDTLGLVGAYSTRFPAAEKWAFGLGAVTASFAFFSALGFGARLLAPVMRSARAWRLLDLGIGLVMWLLALGLLASLR